MSSPSCTPTTERSLAFKVTNSRATADHQAPPGGRLLGKGSASGFAIAVALLAGIAARATGQPAAAASPVGEQARAQSVPALRSVVDVAGKPIAFGAARYYGGVAQTDLGSGMTAIAVGAGGRGYWLATANGTVFGFGDARSYGSIAAARRAHAVAIVATGDAGGYWLACSNGNVFGFGDAKAYGSVNTSTLWTPIVAMAATPHGLGYWLAASGGRVFGYGDAHVYGSPTAELRHDHIVAMAATPDGRGYWLAASDGRVFGYGDARLDGSTGSSVLQEQIVAMAATPDGRGYWLGASDGKVLRYGDAPFYGSAWSALHKRPLAAMAAMPDGRGYWLLPTISPPLARLPPPGQGFLVGHVTAIGDSVMLDAQPDLQADIPGIDVEAAVSRQWYEGIAIAQRLKSEDRLGAVVVIDLGTNGPVSPEQFAEMMNVLAGASRVVFVTVHLPSYYSWSQSVNETLEQCVPLYARARIADFNQLADENPGWFYPDGVHMPIGGPGAKAMASLIKSEI